MRRFALTALASIVAAGSVALGAPTPAFAATITGGGCASTVSGSTMDGGAISAAWYGCVGVNGTTLAVSAHSTVSWPSGGTNACDVVVDIFQEGTDIGSRTMACNVNNGSNAVAVGVPAGHLYTFRWYVYVYHNAAFYTTYSSSPALSYIGGSSKALAAVTVAEIQAWNHVMYVTGGATPAGFDCSGLTQYSYGQAGIALNRTSETQFTQFALVESRGKFSTAGLLPGDLLFYAGDGTYVPPGHVAMYLGNGRLIEASSTGHPVWVQPTSYENTTFYGANRPAP